MKPILLIILFGSLSVYAQSLTLLGGGGAASGGGGGGGPVAFSAKMTTGNAAGGGSQQASGVNTASSTGITVAGGTTCLVVPYLLSVGANTLTGTTATWNGTSMTLHSEATHTNVRSGVFVLGSPASGANTLTLTFAGAGVLVDVYFGAVSFTGSNSSTCVNATDDLTATTGTAIAVTATSTGATVAVFGTDGATPTMNQTALFAESPFGPGGGASYAIGGSGTNSHTFTGAGGALPALSGVHIIP